MQAALITGRRRLELVDFPDPEPGQGMAVVQIARCGVCGTDVHAYRSGQPYPAVLCGHEWVGTISAVGKGVTTLTEGDRVVSAIAPACGRCRYCLAGLAGWCELALAGISGSDPLAPPHGGYAPAIAVDARRLAVIPAGLDDEQGALVEPATVALHALHRQGPRAGQVAVVVGAGPIGLLMLGWLRIAGAGSVVVVEPDAGRQELARRLGADLVLGPGPEVRERLAELTGGLGADLAYECAGLASTVQSTADLLRRGGTMVLVGLAEESGLISPGSWVARELTVVASLAYTHDEFAVTAAMIGDGRLRVRELHELTIGLAGLDATLAGLADGTVRACKVLVDPRA